MSKILVTGGAGFIGYHLAKKLLELNIQIVAIDNLNDYYDPALKKARLKQLEKFPNFKFFKNDIVELNSLIEIFRHHQFDLIIHLAAQAGVGYSFKNPQIYINTNIYGTFNLLELARKFKIKNFIFASSSSVYGDSLQETLSEDDKTEQPISLYGATKKSGELLIHHYAKSFGLNSLVLRFFSVYGPWGRPDMVMFKFTKAILENKPIEIFNFGKHQRNFTYIDDLVEGIVSAINLAKAQSTFEIINLGNSQTVELEHLITLIEKELNKKSLKNYLSLQPGDVIKNCPNTNKAKELLNWQAPTPIAAGVANFIRWYKEYYQV